MRIKNLILISVLIIGSLNIVKAQSSVYDTSSVGKYDMGKLWTFDNFPKDYMQDKYNLKITDEWLEKVRLSSLKFASWCSSSFVSEDGLIMTNHHCIDFVEDRIQKENEDIAKNGFYAPTLQDERKVSGVYVDQLVYMKDITEELRDKEKNNDSAKSKADLLAEIKKNYDKETELNCVVVPFYSGAKYSIYGYKRYNDVRAVYFNESSTGLYGGDPDNFTYPRYDADFAFLRVYDESGNPAKIDNYFKWSKDGPQLDEPIFVVGNPGKTQRLKTVDQIKFMSEVDSRNTAYSFERLMKTYYELIEMYPAEKDALLEEMGAISNSAKVYIGEYNSLKNPYLLVRKTKFENEFKSLIQKDKNLSEKYGHLWESISGLQNELRKFENKRAAYLLSARTLNTELFSTAAKIYELALVMKKKDITKLTDSLIAKLDKDLEKVFDNTKTKRGIKKQLHPYTTTLEMKKLAIQLDLIKLNLGADNEFVKMLMKNFDGEEAAKNLLANTIVFDKDEVKKLFLEGYKSVLNSNDPVLSYIINTREDLEKYQKKYTEISATEEEFENQLGEALHAVYGSRIPPDATFTLRINDGLVKSYEYNGTIAPPFTTFYGMYDRYYSHNKKYPWDLPERWVNASSKMNLSTYFNFVSTNDITGGSSGSPIINKNREIIGIAFDGNIESLAGDFLYDEQNNRCVGVTSQGILEILHNVAGADRIRDELLNGKISK